MNLKDIAQRFFDAEARIERVIFLAGAVPVYPKPDDLRTFLENGSADVLGAPDELMEDDDDFANWCMDNGKLGFLVEFATPFMKPYGEHGSATFSWGHYRVQWVYGDTMEQALDAGFAWVASVRESEKPAVPA